MPNRHPMTRPWRTVCAGVLAILACLAPRAAEADVDVNAGLVLITGSASPSVGTTAGGTAVDITSVESLLAIVEPLALDAAVDLLGLVTVNVDGTSLADVEFGGIPTPGPDTMQSLFTVRSVTPAHAAGTVDVDLVFNVVVKAKVLVLEETVNVTVRLRLANAYTYVGPPALTSVSPGSGPEAGGTAVTLAGSNFRSGMTARFGGTPAASLVVVSPTAATVTSPAGTGTVAVSIQSPDGEIATLPNAFTYTPAIVPPTITSLAPTSGPFAGGTSVLMTGTGFQTGATVTVGGAAASNVLVGGSTQITFTTPAAPGSAGAYPVVVTNPDGGAATPAHFTYVAQSTPTIAGIAPSSGPTTGGVTTAITGTGFEPGAVVTICGTQVTPAEVSATSIVFVTPPCATTGTTPVVVTNSDGGQATTVAGYTYSSAPAIAGVSPATGSVAGGTVITVTGSGFQSGATVLVGDSAGTNVVVAGPTTVIATTPPGAAGAVAVRVTNPDSGQAVAADAFTYVATSSPKMTAVSPTHGPATTLATLTGTGFMDGATVTMCGVTAPAGFVDATTVTFMVPVACTEGAHDITLTNPDGGSDTLGGGFQVGVLVSTPTATGLSPTSGPATGGTIVAISGSGFLNGASVTFGGIPATAVTVVNSTLITATSPAGAGTVAVEVVNPDTGSTPVSGGFTFVAQSTPTIATLSPSQGRVSGGTIVVMTGSGYEPGAVVQIGGAPALVSSVTPMAITFTTPACAAGPQVVTAANPDGGTATMPGGFTCLDVSTPVLTAVTPSAGAVAGGTPVQVVGSGFISGATVLFGSAPLANVNVLSPTVFTGVTTAHAAGTVPVTLTNTDGGTTLLSGGFTFRADACAVTATDSDGDCLPDEWETRYGLNPHSPLCPDGPDCDPDGDGEDNLSEYNKGTHPRGFYRQYFAEGVSSDLFRTTFHVVAAGEPGSAAHVQVRYLLQGGSSGPSPSESFGLTGTALRVVDPLDALGMGSHEFATVVESDVSIAAARSVTWDGSEYGSHAEVAGASPSTTWHFAEGATIGDFELFYLLSNPSAASAVATITYYRPYPKAPIVRQHVVPAQGRLTVWVNKEAPELETEEMSATITATVPVLAERAMYRNAPGRVFASGHAAAGVTAPRASWFFAEGATGEYFDTFLLVSNPHPVDVPIRVTYLLPDGNVLEESFVVNRQSRFNVWVDMRPGMEDTAFSARIDVIGDRSVVAERAMWWPGDAARWHEGHVSAGASAAGTMWVVPQGVAGGANLAETYVLIGNMGAARASVRVDVVADDGTSKSTVLPVEASSRANIPVTHFFPEMAGRRFAVIVTSLGATPMPLVVEGSVYNDAEGTLWEAGASALGVRLR